MFFASLYPRHHSTTWSSDRLLGAVSESFSKTERDLARLDKDIHYLYEDLYKERPPTRVRTKL